MNLQTQRKALENAELQILEALETCALTETSRITAIHAINDCLISHHNCNTLLQTILYILIKEPRAHYSDERHLLASVKPYINAVTALRELEISLIADSKTHPPAPTLEPIT